MQQFSDHNSIIVGLFIPRGVIEKAASNSRRRWKITEEGLSLFQEITSGEGENSGDELLPGDDYDVLEAYMESCMTKCFKSFTCKSKNKREAKVQGEYGRTISSLMKIFKKGKIQRRVVKMYIKALSEASMQEVAVMRSKKFAERLKQLSIDDKLSLDAFMKLKSRSDEHPYRLHSMNPTPAMYCF